VSEPNACACQGEAFDPLPLVGILQAHAGEEGALVPVLQATQDAYGYLPAEALRSIANGLRQPLSEVYGVASFYAQFYLEPRGNHIVRICHGTACHVRGADDVTNAIVGELGVGVGETAADLSVTVESVACVGCCGLAPVALVDGETHGALNATTARRMAAALKRETRS
jgi:NADH:ubiquinone oxidoreductase subunit E